ncbi:substrate-binding domain-containing protein [Opitutus sp. GAS368]|uniref:PstS family phosphate ABC transporter substrate-binding protein n=1 Tax=Opitutus sp. GAS368 TaxID=1882749 RepID=UPI00087CC9BB|nr:substrate-binding domain-containing protein [Opitutus sp. GAS368]SDR90138.1 phosphate transport system substrate-binding protein [Opitutus sp. GAS368]
MKIKPTRALCARALVFGLAVLGAAAAWAQALQTKEAIELQDLRSRMIAAKKAQVYYTGKRFDLDQLPHYTPAAEKLSGTIRIWGLNYLGDCMLGEYWAKGFRKYFPGVKIEYTLPTALTATSGLVAGTCDIGANRKMTFTELLQFERVFNHDPLEIPLATGSLNVTGWSDVMAVYVHKDNPVERLTLDQLDGIFGAERQGGWVGTVWHQEFARGPEKNLRTWGQLGLTGEWADRPIHPFSATVRYDTATKFSDAVLHGSDKWNEQTRMFGNYAGPNGRFVIWAELIAEGISGDLDGIGYCGAQNQTKDMKPVAIEAYPGGPFVLPTLETIQARTYPLFQANYWYINRAPGQPLDPKVREFLRYVLSQEGQAEVVRDGKYLPLNAGLVQAALKSLQ